MEGWLLRLKSDLDGAGANILLVMEQRHVDELIEGFQIFDIHCPTTDKVVTCGVLIKDIDLELLVVAVNWDGPGIALPLRLLATATMGLGLLLDIANDKFDIRVHLVEPALGVAS